MDVRTLVPPEGALLVRLEIHGRADLAGLPPVPAPHQVTISLGDSRLRAMVPPGLGDLGYVLVGSHEHDGLPGDEALLLVRGPLLDAHPTWGTLLLARAAKVFSCDMGPVQALFRQQLARHLLGED